MTTITAVTSAPNAANRRILATMKPPRVRLADPAGSVQVARNGQTGNENMF